MRRVNAHVRGLPADLWQAIRLEAVKRRRTLGNIVTEALRLWLEANSAKEPS